MVVSSRYVTENGGLSIFSKDFSILDKLESIAGSSNGGVARGGRNFF